ncbi:MAG: hypothetical protein J6J21_05015 [Clostridia bacterium]|nr:hypothetical protein [Clostridia bacterium]
MKAFWCAALTLAVLVGAIVCYSLALNDFATELEGEVSGLPQTIDAAKRADKAQTQQILDRLLERVKENELLIHLAVPLRAAGVPARKAHSAPRGLPNGALRGLLRRSRPLPRGDRDLKGF